MPLKIMGDGPLADEVRKAAATLSQIHYLGQQPTSEVYAAMANAKFLVCASECAEAFGLTIVEAFSRGTPVLAADSESVAELITDGHTGLRFASGNPGDLAAKASLLLADSSAYLHMRRQCRRHYEERYTDRVNYKLLMDIYARARTLAPCTA